MNLKELNDWAKKNYFKRDNVLIEEGAEEKKISKIRGKLKMIKDRCPDIIKNMSWNDRNLKEIENSLMELKKWGITAPILDDDLKVDISIADDKK